MWERIPSLLFVLASTPGAWAQTIELDFEDGLTPVAHGWVNLPAEHPSSTHTVVGSRNGPSGAGAQALRSVGPERHGWLLDLDTVPGLALDRDWIFRADVRNPLSGSEPVASSAVGIGMRVNGVHQVGLVVGGPPGFVSINDDAWHTLEISFERSTATFEVFVDGQPGQFEVQDATNTSHPAFGATTNAVRFSFGNTGDPPKTLDWDNVAFSTFLPKLVQEILPSCSTSFLFGSSPRVDGDTLVLGATLAGAGGAVFLYERHPSGSWREHLRIDYPNAQAGGAFGHTSGLDGDTLVVAALGDDNALGTNAGAAFVFVRSGTTWVQQGPPLTSGVVADNQSFGQVDISGDTIIVGARFENPAGAAYVFVRSGTTWTQQATLTCCGGGNPQFGNSVAIDGDTAVIGAFNSGGHLGAAYVSERTGTTWSTPVQLLASNGVVWDEFGTHVDICGDRIVIGANCPDVPNCTGAGQVYVFERMGSSWCETAILTPADGDVGDTFGSFVACEGGTVLVGAPRHDHAGVDLGPAAYVFRWTGTSWTEICEVFPGDELADDAFASGGTLDGESKAIVGGREHDHPGMVVNSGGAYVFAIDPPQPPGAPFCFGIGCLCGNDDPDAGCDNSTPGGSGALLVGSGSTSVALDDLSMTAIGCPPSNSGLFFMGGVTFTPVFVGDGLGCTGGLFRFAPGVVDFAGDFAMATPVAAAPAGMIQPGDTRHFQAWTRDVLCGPPPAPCPSPCSNNSNLSNGYTVTFSP